MTSPFVPLYRQFPTDDAHNLEKQLVNFHNSTNAAVNSRIISVFDTVVIDNGEIWFPDPGDSQLRNGNRVAIQVADPTLIYDFGPVVINQLTKLYGTFFDGVYWQALPYVDTAAITNQIGLKVLQNASLCELIISKGTTAPSISNGIVVIEYL